MPTLLTDGDFAIEAAGAAGEEYSARNNSGVRLPGLPNVQMIAISRISLNPDNPRKSISDADLRDLAASMRLHGLRQPITVRPLPDSAGDDSVQIVMGERRYRAARHLKWTEIPAIVEEMSDADALALALEENVKRADLTPIEEARGYARLLELDSNLTQQDLAGRIGVRQGTVSKLLGLLRLPTPVQEMIDRGDLSRGHGYVLLPIADDPGACTELAISASRNTEKEKEAWPLSLLEARVREHRQTQEEQNTPASMFADDKSAAPVADATESPKQAEASYPCHSCGVAPRTGPDNLCDYCRPPSPEQMAAQREKDERAAQKATPNIPPVTALPVIDWTSIAATVKQVPAETFVHLRSLDNKADLLDGTPKAGYTATGSKVPYIVIDSTEDRVWAYQIIPQEHVSSDRVRTWADVAADPRRGYDGVGLTFQGEQVLLMAPLVRFMVENPATTSAPAAPPPAPTQGPIMGAETPAPGRPPVPGLDGPDKAPEASGDTADRTQDALYQLRMGAAPYEFAQADLRASAALVLRRAAAMLVVEAVRRLAPIEIEEAAKACGIKFNYQDLSGGATSIGYCDVRRGLSRYPLSTILRFGAEAYIRTEQRTYGDDVRFRTADLLAQPNDKEKQSVLAEINASLPKTPAPVKPAPAPTPAPDPTAGVLSRDALALLTAINDKINDANRDHPEKQTTLVERLDIMLLARASAAEIDTDAVIAAAAQAEAKS